MLRKMIDHVCFDRWVGQNSKSGVDFLPGDKQFLITEKVPCSRRVDDIQNAAAAVLEV